MPRKPKDPDNPVTGKTVTVKLPGASYIRLRDLAEARGVTRGEFGRELLDRGMTHLVVETGPVSGDVEDDRRLLDHRVDYALLHLKAVLIDHAPADPAVAVVAARRVSRGLAQWADEQALMNGQLLPAMVV